MPLKELSQLQHRMITVTPHKSHAGKNPNVGNVSSGMDGKVVNVNRFNQYP